MLGGFVFIYDFVSLYFGAFRSPQALRVHIYKKVQIRNSHSIQSNARSDTKVASISNLYATLTVLTDTHGSILTDTLLRALPRLLF